MLFFTVLKVALRSLYANKLRSFLAMLGIIIGVGAVISMLAFGAGAQRQVMDRVTAMGTNLLIVRPGNRGTGGVISGTQQNLTLEDAQAVVTDVTNVLQIAPVVGGSAQVKYLGKNARVSIIGSAPPYIPMRNFEVEKGRCFTESEADKLAHVAVLGPTTVTNLFDDNDPIGETVKLNGINFLVIGVLKAKGDQGFYNPDDQIIMPYSTAMKQVFGVDKLREIDIEGVDQADINVLQDDIATLLRKRHRIQTGFANDFFVQNQAELIETASSFSRMFAILLGGIASISLLVGGIGIMNVMLVTVTERTREIGVRKAIGARNRDILSQFLIEAMLMSGVGGVIGVVIGIGIAEAVARYSTFSTIVETSSILLALSFSAGVGIFFGYYPAYRAAALDPIDALRYE
jgi:putative ABC transport system permease protein